MTQDADGSAPMRGSQATWQDVIDRLKEAGDWEAAAALWDARAESARLKEAAGCHMSETDIQELKRMRDSLLEERETWRRTHMTLTDAEREAVGYFADFFASPRERDARHAATLRGLLKRLG